MGVDLGGCYVGMAQHELHTAQIGTCLKHMTSEGMAQNVRRNVSGINASYERRFL